MAHAVDEHANIKFIHGLIEQALEALRIDHAFVHFHPQTGFVELFQQSPGNAAAATEPSHHRAHERFGFNRFFFTDAIVDVIVVQGSG